MSNLAEQIREALRMFARSGTAPALIGGLAVVAHQVVRATQDVDFLVEVEAADRVHAALLGLGYRCLYRSEDAANYVRETEGLDLLYARRPLARRLLAQASERETPMGRMRIISRRGMGIPLCVGGGMITFIPIFGGGIFIAVGTVFFIRVFI